MQSLLPNYTYHIYNHANGFENVFREAENYRFFMAKYQLHIWPIAETYAYCLMPNHFHLVVRIRKRETIETLIRNKNNSPANSSKVPNFGRVGVSNVSNVSSDSEIEKFLSKQFANLFSSYTQSFNKVYGRMGSLFIKNFKRVETIQMELREGFTPSGNRAVEATCADHPGTKHQGVRGR
jgi:REP element-mobilizing transposase RayT